MLNASTEQMGVGEYVTATEVTVCPLICSISLYILSGAFIPYRKNFQRTQLNGNMGKICIQKYKLAINNHVLSSCHCAGRCIEFYLNITSIPTTDISQTRPKWMYVFYDLPLSKSLSLNKSLLQDPVRNKHVNGYRKVLTEDQTHLRSNVQSFPLSSSIVTEPVRWEDEFIFLWILRYTRRPTGEIIRDVIDPVPLTHWRWKLGGHLKAWLSMLKEGLTQWNCSGCRWELPTRRIPKLEPRLFGMWLLLWTPVQPLLGECRHK